MLLLGVSLALLMLIDTSLVYHNIRGQTVIKLYVIFNLLEILDKLLVRDARARARAARVCVASRSQTALVRTGCG